MKRPMSSYRSLTPEKIVETIAMIVQRIDERFPESGLGNVGRELHQISKEAVLRAEEIRRPQSSLRAVIGVLVTIIVALMATLIARLRISDEVFQIEHFVQLLDSSLASLVLVGAAIAFLVTLELRLKRDRALKAIHELRALAHIVDMHQLTKDPELVTGRSRSGEGSPKRAMTPFELVRYLDYCSELLSLVSKTAALYVQDFPDTVALGAVDQLATLTNGLSRNIWQKIMIVENIIGPFDGRRANPQATDT